MNKKDLYKLYQITRVFINKYDYSQFVLKTKEELSDEAWLTNYKNPNYQVIRVSFEGPRPEQNESKILGQVLDYFKHDAKKEDLKFLDIHICSEIYDKNLEDFDYINIDENYTEGVDLHSLYPEIYTCIHKVDNPDKEIKDVLNEAKANFKKKLKQLPFFQRHMYLYTYIIIGICCLMFILSSFLSTKYDEASVYLLLGADYKLLTLGCYQLYRLITYAFLHSSFIHLFCNMVSLLALGRYVEGRYGHTRFLIFLFSSIICGSLTQGILSDNSLCIGMSGGIYGLFVIYIIDTVATRIIDLRRFIPTIILNIMLNFTTSVAWMCHLGGAIAGIAAFLAIAKPKNYSGIAILIVLIVGLLVKYLLTKSIDTFYGGTDLEYINLLEDIGFNANSAYDAILKAYAKYGG